MFLGSQSSVIEQHILNRKFFLQIYETVVWKQSNIVICVIVPLINASILNNCQIGCNYMTDFTLPVN